MSSGHRFVSSTHGVPITLLDVVPDNYERVMSLCVAPEQERHVGTVAEAMAHAYFHNPHYEMYCVHHIADAKPIGFVMLEEIKSFGDVRLVYKIHTFLIDCHYQRRGYGTMAIVLLMGALRQLTPLRDIAVVLRVNQDNTKTIEFYKKNGFVFAVDEKAPSEKYLGIRLLDKLLVGENIVKT